MKQALSRRNVWESLPKPVRRAAGSVLSVMPLGLLLGKRFRRTLAWARAAQHWPAERARAYQLEQLRKVCSLAYDRTAYYRRTFDLAAFHPNDLRQPEDIRALPTIDKHVVNTYVDELLAQSKKSLGVDYTTTGGTGGNPLNFYINASRSSIEYAFLVASWERVGFRLGMPMAVIRGRIVEPDRDGVRHTYEPLLRHHYFSNFHTTDADLAQYIEKIRGIGDCVLHAYPSSAASVARYLRRNNIRAPENIRAILCESEMVYPEQRELVESTFGRRLMSCYGSTEKLTLAAECEHSNRYHVWPTYGYFELIDENGQPVTTPGQKGEIVGTGFINTVMPFIRYRTGDYAVYAGASCSSCGRQHMVLDQIEGHRQQQYLVASDGSEISWTAMNMHDDTFDHVRQFQVSQSVPGHITLRVVPTAGFSDDDQQRILRNLGRKFDGRMTLVIERVESIPLSPRGKAIYVDQKIPRPSETGGSGPSASAG